MHPLSESDESKKCLGKSLGSPKKSSGASFRHPSTPCRDRVWKNNFWTPQIKSIFGVWIPHSCGQMMLESLRSQSFESYEAPKVGFCLLFGGFWSSSRRFEDKLFLGVTKCKIPFLTCLFYRVMFVYTSLCQL